MTDDTNESAPAPRKDPVAPKAEAPVPPPLDGLPEDDTAAPIAPAEAQEPVVAASPPESALDRDPADDVADDAGDPAREADRIAPVAEAAAVPAAAAPAAAAPLPEPPAAAPPAPAAQPRAAGPAYPAAFSHMTLPNILTVFRGFAIFVLLVILLWPWGTNLTLALIVFGLAAITDWLDGRIARAWNLTSDLGRMMDSIADKLLIAVTMLALCAIGVIDGVNVLAAALILAREIAMSGYREHVAGRGIVIPPSAAGKWKTTFQMVALAALMAAPLAPFPTVARVAALLILWAAMVMTVFSFVEYVKETPKGAFDEK